MSVQYNKVTPIYQCIDSGNWKGAVKLCQRKDVEKWDITKSLMAYCLLQLNKNEQALEVALEVKANEPTDEGALSALTLTFKSMGRHEDAVECYENAARKCPGNEAFATEALNSYAGMGEFKKMQQGSQKLYKSSGNPKYVFWSVSCMLLQDYPVAMLDLAEKMLFKVFDGDKKGEQPGGEELSLLVTILRSKAAHPSVAAAGKCVVLRNCLEHIQTLSSRQISTPIKDETMVKARDGGDGSLVKSHPQHLQLLQIQILKDLRHYQSLAMSEEGGSGEGDADEELKQATVSMIGLLKEVLVDLPDQWDALQTLVQMHCDAYVKKIRTCCDDGLVKETDCSGQRSCIDVFHDELLGMQESHPSARGTFLAEMYFLQELKSVIQDGSCDVWWERDYSEAGFALSLSELHLADESLHLSQLSSRDKEMIRLLIQYITKFDTKQCCFTDVKPYLKTLLTVKAKEQDEGTLPTYSLTPAALVIQAWTQHRIALLNTELTELTSSAVSDAGAGEEVLVKTATLLLCRLSKLLQIDYYFSINADTTPADSTTTPAQTQRSVPVLKDEYANMYGLLAGKGIGGLREVQPGDELLMLCSAEIGRQVQIASSSTASSSSSEVLAKCLEWTETVLVGREASPHNYCFSVESLEPLRQLGCVEYAMDGFNKLEVKYIQLDSMSYLILPALLEGGLFTEYQKLSKNIVKFHSGAKRDTLSMVGKCLKNANYAKSLELGKFVKKCQNSVQLALTRAELPLIEVVETLHTPSEVMAYLQSYVTEAIPESQAELAESEISNLNENMDYSLLTRISEENSCDGSSSESEAAVHGGDVYRRQYMHRIVSSQSFLRVMVHFLQGECDQALEDRLSACWTEQFGTLVSFGGLFGTDKNDESVGMAAASTQPSSPMKWSQSIDYGSLPAERMIWILLYRLCLFSSQCIQVVKAPALATTDDTTEDSRVVALESLGSIISQTFSDLRVEMFEATSSRFVLSGDQKIFLQPSWIKKISSTVRLLLCWGAVLLSSARQQMGGPSETKGGKSSAAKKKKAAKKAKSAAESTSNDSPEGRAKQAAKECFVATTRVFRSFTEDVSAAVGEEVEDTSRSISAVVSFLDSTLPQTTASTIIPADTNVSETGVVDSNGNISYQAARVSLAKRLLSSQTLSCTRLSHCIQKKMPLLQHFNSGF